MPLPNDRILALTKLKAIPDDKKKKKKNFFFVKMIISVSDSEKNHCRKRENAGLPAFSPVSTMFSKVFFCRAVKTMDCLGKD